MRGGSIPFGRSISSIRDLRKSRSLCRHCCILAVREGKPQGIVTAVGRPRFVWQCACSRSSISSFGPGFRAESKGSLNDRESQEKKQHRIFAQRAKIGNPNRLIEW